MNIFLAILGGVMLLAIILFLCVIIATIQAEMQADMCDKCPFKHKCDAHMHGDSFTSECGKHGNMFPHNPMNNLF